MEQKLKVEYVPLKSIKPYKNNAKEHPQEQIEQIKASIKEFGNIDPIGVWHDEIVEGHGRYEAAKQLKLKIVPIIRLDDLTDEQRRAYALVHNQLTMNTGWDKAMFDMELSSISIDMSKFGIEAVAEEMQEQAEKYTKIEDYAAWRRVYSPNTSLGIQWVASSVDEVFKFYNANQCLDVDYISFRPFESTNGKYYSTEEKRAQAREISAAIEQLASNDERVIRNFKWDLLDRQENDCTANWAQIAINEVGEVMYCCHKPYQIIGHVMDDDILQKKEKARTNMKMCDIPCRMTAPNMFASKVKEKRKDEYFI